MLTYCHCQRRQTEAPWCRKEKHTGLPLLLLLFYLIPNAPQRCSSQNIKNGSGLVLTESICHFLIFIWKHYCMCECVNSSFHPDEHFLNPLLVYSAVCNLGLPIHLMLCHHYWVEACSLQQEGQRVNVCLGNHNCVCACAHALIDS